MLAAYAPRDMESRPKPGQDSPGADGQEGARSAHAKGDGAEEVTSETSAEHFGEDPRWGPLNQIGLTRPC